MARLSGDHAPQNAEKTNPSACECHRRARTDAAGISYVRNGEVVIYKRPKPAHKLHFNPPEGTRAVMGHTRMTTQGDGKFNYNNHPFLGIAGDTSFAFVHNGVLWNDKELRKDKLIPDTHIETDSYAACQLIEQQNKLDFESLKFMAETVEGNFTFTVLDDSISKNAGSISMRTLPLRRICNERRPQENCLRFSW